MSNEQKDEIRRILRSLHEDLDGASTQDHKIEAVQAALLCLLDALADD